MFNAGFLLLGLLKKSVFSWQPGWLRFVFRLLIANIAMGLFLVFYVGNIEEWLQKSMDVRIIDLSFLVFGGIACYVACLSIIGFKWREVYR
jgi:putative peptidoglycan lipid II flippase